MLQTRYLPARRDSGRFAESCGRMRAREKTLLGSDNLDELLAAADVATVMQTLKRWGWIAGEPREGEDWDGTLTRSLRYSDRELMSIHPQGSVIRLFVLTFDLLNLAALLKAKARSLSPGKIPLHPRGLHDLAVLESMVNRMEFVHYPEVLAAQLACLREITIAGTPGQIAGAVVRAHFLALREAVRREGSPLFALYLDRRADLENIMFVARKLAFSDSWPEEGLPLPPATVDERLLKDVRDQTDLERRLAGTVYGPFMERSREEDGPFSLDLMEKERDDFLTDVLQPAKYVSFGPEPLWAFYLARESDARNIRAVVIGILFDQERGAIRERLRRPYV